MTIDRAQSVDHFVPSFSLDSSMAEFNKIEMNSHSKCLTNVNNLENNRDFSKNNVIANNNIYIRGVFHY